jgi:hypothetical protein
MISKSFAGRVSGYIKTGRTSADSCAAHTITFVKQGTGQPTDSQPVPYYPIKIIGGVFS